MVNEEFAYRMSYCINLFADILPIYDEKQRTAFRLAFGHDLAKIIPEFFQDLGRYVIKNEDEALPYLNFLKQSLDYIIGYSDTAPQIDAPTDMVEKTKKQIKGWKFD